jgi:hypothetical protein
MKIIIYHGKQGTGKTTLLTSEALRFANSFAEAQKIVSDRKILNGDTGKFLIIDECTINDLDTVNEFEVDWLYLGFQELPSIEDIENKFKVSTVLDVRETMFPFCKYVNFDGSGLYYADFGGYYLEDKSYEDLIKEISIPPKTKEIIIPNIEEMKNFLEKHKEPPTNFSEWGLDYAALMRVSNKLNQNPDGKIIITDDESCAIANYNCCEIKWIEDLFFNLFDKA